jgi:glutaconate CoA-transferase subunit A
MNKLISMSEAVSMVNSRSMLALGGVTLYRRPMAFVLNLLDHYQRSGTPTELTLLSFTAGLESDLLVGSRLATTVRSCYFGLEIFGLAPMFTFFANRGELRIIEETEASLALGLRAQMAGIGFMPGRAWSGTDLLRLRPDVRMVRDPYTGEELTAFPAIRPDLAVIHALKADLHGNAIIGNNRGVDAEIAEVASQVIITAEEILPALNQADIPAPFVTAVVAAPQGAAPTSCHPLYPLDGESILAYTEKVSDTETFHEYLAGILLSL